MKSEIAELVAKYGFRMIPWSAMRSCPCPKCGKKSLGYANHAHAYGYKNYDRISCRSCGAGWRPKIAEAE